MIIELKNLSKKYKKGKRTLEVINDFSYTFKSNNIYLLKGSSGSGKTTILSLIGLLDNETDGSILFDGKDVCKLSSKEKSRIRKEDIGFIFQDYNLLEGMSIEENIGLTYLDSKISDLDERILDIMSKMNLSHRSGHYPFELSGGEKQRVAIARAIIKNPRLLICDEPVSNLDKKNIEQMVSVLRDIKKRRDCIILISCHTSDFDAYADNIIEM